MKILPLVKSQPDLSCNSLVLIHQKPHSEILEFMRIFLSLKCSSFSCFSIVLCFNFILFLLIFTWMYQKPNWQKSLQKVETMDGKKEVENHWNWKLGFSIKCVSLFESHKRDIVFVLLIQQRKRNFHETELYKGIIFLLPFLNGTFELHPPTFFSIQQVFSALHIDFSINLKMKMKEML